MIRALRVLIPGEGETKNVPRVLNPNTLVEVENTVLDPCIQKEGCVLELHKPVESFLEGFISSIKLAPQVHSTVEGIVLLQQAAVLFNNVLRVNEQAKAGEGKPHYLKTSVQRYQKHIIGTISGKAGQLNRLLMTSREIQSVRAVALPCANWSPEWIGIPGRAMDRMEIKHGTLCLVVRFPVVWDGGVEVMRARRTPHDSLEIHPLLHEQFNLDHDGDTMSVYVVPDDVLAQEEAEAHVIDFLKNRGALAWPAQFLRTEELYQTTKPKPDMTDIEAITIETKDRMVTTGFSISPEDIMKGKDSRCIRILEAATGKDLTADNLAIAKGLSIKDFRKRLLQVNTANVVMKIYMGPVGSMANKIKTIASCSCPWIKRSAMDLSQYIQQALLDSKHIVGNVEDEKFMRILDVMNKRGPDLRFAMPGVIVNRLISLGIPKDKSGSFIAYIFWAYPGLRLLESFKEDLSTDTYEEIEQMFLVCTLPSNINEIDDLAVEAFRALMAKTQPDTCDEGAWNTLLSGRFWAMNMGVNDVIKAEFPVSRFISRDANTNDETLSTLANQILLKGQNDPKGICREAMKKHLKEEEDA